MSILQKRKREQSSEDDLAHGKIQDAGMKWKSMEHRGVQFAAAY